MTKVVNTELLMGTNNPARLKSCRVFDKSGQPIAVENGTFVSVGQLVDGEREVHKATVVDFGGTGVNIGIVATPEITYDPRLGIEDFTNEAGEIVRVYMLDVHEIFAIKNGTDHPLNVPVKVGNLTLLPIDKNARGFIGYEVIEATE